MERKAALLALLFLMLCSLSGCKQRTKALIVLDDQWAVQQAQADCRSRQQEGVALCAGDPAVMIKDLEAQTARAFQTNPECRGIAFATLNASDDPSQLNSRRTWWLFLELTRSNVAGQLRYTLASSHDPHAHGSETGQGVPDSIVGGFCTFVRQGGTAEESLNDEIRFSQACAFLSPFPKGFERNDSINNVGIFR